MSVEVLPIGTKCNVGCSYCYQAHTRAGDAWPAADLKAMTAALDAAGARFTLFGGEPLLAEGGLLEALFRHGKEKWGGSGIQTSLVAATDEHFRMFRDYSVHVGVSLDGPGGLNAARCGTSATARAEASLARLLDGGIPTSLITTLTRENAGDKLRLAQFLDWLERLVGIGLKDVCLHFMEDDNPAARGLALEDAENAGAIIAVAERLAGRAKIQPVADMASALLGDGRPVACIWNRCDPYRTEAVHGVGPSGEIMNCLRAWKAGFPGAKAAPGPAGLRAGALLETECAGCRFHFACGGGCPGEGIGGDWRRKTAHCGAIRAVFEWIERRLREIGMRIGVRPPAAGAHGDAPHGDSPHGDAHGDHTDGGTR